MGSIIWPEGKKFAFTIFDDTDLTTIDNGSPVYRLLQEMGFRTTKSVWPVKGKCMPKIGGDTCDDQGYLDWTLNLQKQGFEIALHGATYHSSIRDDSLNGIEQFQGYFGSYPSVHANHYENKDNIYWGDARLTGINKLIYNLLTRFRKFRVFQGHDESSEFFWGDLCKERVKYVRNFVYADINTMKLCPYMPYYDPARPYVNYWFASSEGGNIHSFNNMISEENQDRLESEGGACIMYTHFANGFCRNGEIDPRFKYLMGRLSQKSGWFVPVSKLLNHILSVGGHHEISPLERFKLEAKWVMGKIMSGGTS